VCCCATAGATAARAKSLDDRNRPMDAPTDDADRGREDAADSGRGSGLKAPVDRQLAADSGRGMAAAEEPSPERNVREGGC
jgi:hypothetical protein